MLKLPSNELRAVLAWNGGPKTRCHFALSSLAVSKLGRRKYVGFSVWLTPFFRVFAQPKQVGIVPPLISLERDVQPGVHVVREVPS
jgi:hypothetical protein